MDLAKIRALSPRLITSRRRPSGEAKASRDALVPSHRQAVRDGARGIQLTTHSPALTEQLYRPCGFETISRLSIFERGISE